MRIERLACIPPLALLIMSTILSGCAAPQSAPTPAPAVPVYVPASPPTPAPTPDKVAEPRPEPAPAAAAAAPEPPSPAQARLAEAIALYEKGDFNGAIRKLTASPELASKVIPPELQPAVFKYAAFSYCVTNRRNLCRRQFDLLLAVDPAYELTPLEAGHPIWGPIFVQAKRAAASKRK